MQRRGNVYEARHRGRWKRMDWELRERTGAGICWVHSARCYINISLHPLIPL